MLSELKIQKFLIVVLFTFPFSVASEDALCGRLLLDEIFSVIGSELVPESTVALSENKANIEAVRASGRKFLEIYLYLRKCDWPHSNNFSAKPIGNTTLVETYLRMINRSVSVVVNEKSDPRLMDFEISNIVFLAENLFEDLAS